MVHALRRLLEALESTSLLDLVDAFAIDLGDRRGDRAARVEGLCASAAVDLVDVVTARLVTNEVRTACRRLGLDGTGRRDELSARLLNALRAARPFDAARAIARALGLRSRAEWTAFCRGQLPDRGLLPVDVPRHPDGVYAEWSGWNDWLGTPPRARVKAAQIHDRFRAFDDARAFARGLRLFDRAHWEAYCRGELRDSKGTLPDDVPRDPRRVYRDRGWRGTRDWLGTTDLPGPPEGRWPYGRARQFARELGLESRDAWVEYCRGRRPDLRPRDARVPDDPARSYRRAWRGWEDWLGLPILRGSTARWRPFEEAREFVHTLALTNKQDWRAFCAGRLEHLPELPADVPATPDKVYRVRGWTSWGDFLGSGFVAQFLRAFRPFDQAREFAQALDVGTEEEWRALCSGGVPGKAPPPSDIPNEPWWVYRDEGWTGWGDFLGTGRIATQRRSYRPFADARAFARALDLRGVDEWLAFAHGERPDLGTLPPDIPVFPGPAYEGEWAGWPDFLGGSARFGPRTAWRPFEAAREFVQGLELEGVEQWRSYCKGGLEELEPRPEDIPTRPAEVYAEDGWKGFGDFLGTERPSNLTLHRSWRSFVAARRFARTLGLSSQREWTMFCRGELPQKGELPVDIPRNPLQAYARMGWTSWGDFLGTGRVADQLRVFRPFDEARAFARALGIANQAGWFAWCKEQRARGTLPRDIPVGPHNTYRDAGWAGFGDWLGTSNVSPSERSRSFRDFKAARAFARSLGLANGDEWMRFAHGELEDHPFPDDLPVAPAKAYEGKGWKGWIDFLGSDREPRPHQDWMPFKEARRFARTLGLRTSREWARWAKGELPQLPARPLELSRRPDHNYRGKGWRGWSDFLGQQ